MKLIVWLGNPGLEYVKTRHNIWFIMLDDFCYQNNIWPRKKAKEFSAEIIKQDGAIFCKPQTFMNKSGEAVKKIIDFYKLHPEDILVLHDDIDLATGVIQKKIGWSHAGHNGIKSILLHLGNINTFTKIRIWVDRPATKEEVVEYVLYNFSQAELKKIKENQEVISWFIKDFIGN